MTLSHVMTNGQLFPAGAAIISLAYARLERDVEQGSKLIQKTLYAG